MTDAPNITPVILAGGRSRRFGRNKAAEPFAGEPLLRRVIRRAVSALDASEAIIVVADLERAAELPLDSIHRVVVDAIPDCGALGGIYTGLRAARTEWTLTVACDMPFLSAPLLQYLAGFRSDAVDVVAPVIDGRPEPTHALYSRRCLPAIEQRLRAGELKASGFYDAVRVRYVAEPEARRFDPELLSFFNVNRPEDLARALEIVACQHAQSGCLAGTPTRRG